MYKSKNCMDTVSSLAIFFYFNILTFQLQSISKHFYIFLSVQLAFALTHFYPQILNYFIVFGLCHVSISLFPNELENASSLQISTVMNLNLLKSPSHPLLQDFYQFQKGRNLIDLNFTSFAFLSIFCWKLK